MVTRACHVIQTGVAFLTTRVKAPDKDNWGKLKQVLQYCGISLLLESHLANIQRFLLKVRQT
jgi:hypothetical protein